MTHEAAMQTYLGQLKLGTRFRLAGMPEVRL